MLPDPAWVRVVLLIARREFLTRVRTRFFLIGTIVMVVAAVGYTALQANVIAKAGATAKLAYTSSTAVLSTPLAAELSPLGVKVTTSTVASVADGQALVRDGKVDALISGDPAAPTVAVKDKLDPQVQAGLTALVRQEAFNRTLATHGVSPAEVSGEVAAAKPDVQFLDPGAAQKTERLVTGVIVAVILYVLLLLYGQIVASGVVEEKANRIVEILLSTVRPRQLLLGKVLGIGLVGAVQLVAVGAAGLIAVTKTHLIALPSFGVETVAGGLMWFVLGFVLFALLYAAGGSLVSRQEDLGAVLSPLTVMVVGTYLAFFWVIGNTTNPIAIVLSMIPPFAPILMPSLMATGDVSAWQVAVAVVLTVLAIAGVNYLAARIYSNSVMRTGVRVSFREAWSPRA